ncbi:hypothetical protein L226DRAFT_572648 [Lentinus tigrinus ALCF2SS1-7]|uniref:uncharacterized protein n=1 Tax=Lentinus tigrinus ALCF2SS1-7 TaxID=1328758 RepID=UPI0011661810|nr:hypothetical protein L226DRAFT_572648 [Lentinus tigrinus ALCF2SS1-7]
MQSIPRGSQFHLTHSHLSLDSGAYEKHPAELVMRTFRNEEDTQPHIRNMITHGDCPVLIHNQEVGNAHLYTIPRPPTPPSDFSNIRFELYVQGPSDEDVTLDEVLIILDLFYSPPSQPIVDHGPARPDTAFAILPFDETMSLLSEGESEQESLRLVVIGMQPQYEDNEEDWLLEILLNNEEDDEVED